MSSPMVVTAPGAEAPEQFFLNVRRKWLLRKFPECLDRLLHLPQISSAADTKAKMYVKSDPLLKRQRSFQVVGDRVRKLLAGHTAGKVFVDKVLEVIARHGGDPPLRYCSSVDRTPALARCSNTR